MRLIRTVRKYLTVKRKIRRQYVLNGGPLNNETVWLSTACRTTLSFTLKGQTGRYVQDELNRRNGLVWEQHAGS
jgi:hypothetical protein